MHHSRTRLPDSNESCTTWHHGRVLTSLPTAPYSRRNALKIAGAASVGALTFGVTSCSDTGTATATAEVDQLIAQADRARADATAASAAIALAPERVSALTTISAERAAHATALDDEISRAAGRAPGATTPTVTTTASVPPAGIDSLRESLAESARDAGDLARTASGYRAGLLGSVSASCATQVVVLLS